MATAAGAADGDADGAAPPVKRAANGAADLRISAITAFIAAAAAGEMQTSSEG